MTSAWLPSTYGDQALVTETQLAELSALLPRKWEIETRKNFLGRVIRGMDRNRYDPDGLDLPPEKVRSRCDAIVKASRVYLKVLRDIPAGFFERSDWLVPDDRSTQTSMHASRAEKDVELLRVRMSEYAASVSVGAHVRPKIDAAKEICESCVAAHLAVTHELPSGDHQYGWFVGFMHRVGELAGVTIGRNIVAAAIKRERTTG